MTTRLAIVAGAFAALPTAALLLTACDTHPTGHPATWPTTVSTPTASAAIPSQSPPPTTPLVRPDPNITTAVIPVPDSATRTPITVATAWAIAANSSSYLDPTPGVWTIRAEPLVTGDEAAAEATQREAGGGSTWAQIQSDECVSSVRDVTAAIPIDAPVSPAARVVDVSATSALSCASGTVQLSPFAAQLIVRDVGGRWLVAAVTH